MEHSYGNVNNFLGFFKGLDCTNLRKCPHQTFLLVPREQEGRKECVPSTEESYFVSHFSVSLPIVFVKHTEEAKAEITVYHPARLIHGLSAAHC